jgi:hypothetical protein
MWQSHHPKTVSALLESVWMLTRHESQCGSATQRPQIMQISSQNAPAGTTSRSPFTIVILPFGEPLTLKGLDQFSCLLWEEQVDAGAVFSSHLLGRKCRTQTAITWVEACAGDGRQVGVRDGNAIVYLVIARSPVSLQFLVSLDRVETNSLAHPLHLTPRKVQPQPGRDCLVA